MFSLPAPPARLLISLAFSLIIPRLNSSLGSSVLPARIVSFNFWLCSAISRSFRVAALDPEEADANDIVVGTLRTVLVGKPFDGCCPVCPGGWVAGVVDVDGCVARGFDAGVEGVVPGFRNEVKELMVAVAPKVSFKRNTMLMVFRDKTIRSWLKFTTLRIRWRDQCIWLQKSLYFRNCLSGSINCNKRCIRIVNCYGALALFTWAIQLNQLPTNEVSLLESTDKRNIVILQKPSANNHSLWQVDL